MPAADRPDPAWLRALLTAHNAGAEFGGMSSSTGRGLSRAETGALLKGVGPVEDATFRMRYLGQQDNWQVVFTALRAKARFLVRREELPKIHCDDCLSRLVSLVVNEERLREPTNVYRAQYMGITLGVWRYRYDKPHSRLKVWLDIWAGTAVTQVRLNYFEREQRHGLTSTQERA